ncbi:lactate utilization protein C [Prevotella sp. kh1p2]|uniref:LutC/YkgG family protein n=1 Tax=Prevotella sp. kh1p2 TaxID=1761883 RepID=UPI0008C0EE0E|nr:LUD domain-containing protein [Prevotella sp. kh1p2]SES74111.1 L-lactate dehydrogenase complex protein LldG [Prevotella sp. kh1p2]SNU10579.1 L-lactate dehydrogenase complex protein LldG [Prevotellaceae bacterium KH2P17]
MNKEELFSKLKANTREQYDMPDMHINGITYPDTCRQFKEMTETVGGKVVEAKKTDDLNLIIRNIYPEAQTFASNLPFIDIAQKNPDTVADAKELNGTDVGIIQGELGVAENACVWVPQTMKEKAVCFISEYLVILLDRQNIVNNMHEAYSRIEMNSEYNFGTFISGPSKTADIEQALVMGAQAARGVTVLLLD